VPLSVASEVVRAAIARVSRIRPAGIRAEYGEWTRAAGWNSCDGPGHLELASGTSRKQRSYVWL
jgi:hypothetical protein